MLENRVDDLRRWLIARIAALRGIDPRALDPLLTVLAAGDLDDARQAADGLRDLREPVAAQSLLHAVVTRNDAELRAIATHALVMLGPTARAEAAAALAQIAADDDPDLRRLAELWGDAT